MSLISSLIFPSTEASNIMTVNWKQTVQKKKIIFFGEFVYREEMRNMDFKPEFKELKT